LPAQYPVCKQPEKKILAQVASEYPLLGDTGAESRKLEESAIAGGYFKEPVSIPFEVLQ
jgi:hypothetical protein